MPDSILTPSAKWRWIQEELDKLGNPFWTPETKCECGASAVGVTDPKLHSSYCPIYQTR